MQTYVSRRLLQMIPILIGVSMIIFLVIKLAPGDPFSNMVDPRMDPRKIEELRERYGFNGSIPEQYWGWVKQIAAGNLGYSLRFKTPVTEIILERLGPTVALGFTALLIQYLLGIPVGVISATKQHSWFDNVVTVLTFAGISIPAFFFGLLLLKWFALGGLKLFPSSGYVTAGSGLTGLARMLDIAHHLVLPALALGITGIAGLMRYVRSSMLEVLRQDYVRTARAKGLGEKVVIYKHALRNALIPVVTLIGFDLPALVGGAIITETIFMWPGIGRLAFTAITERDYPVLMAINLMFAVMTMLGNLVADIGYAIVDPRIRYD